MDIRQSSLYKTFLEKIGWQVKKIGEYNIFLRNIPIFGKIAKLQKIKKPIHFDEIEEFTKRERITQITIEPDEPENNILTAQFLAHGYKINKSPFLPTKTIHIDLTRSEEQIFKSFSQEKRRAVRKAIKNKVNIEESTDIESFIRLKRSYFPIFGFLLNHEIRNLWKTFYQKKAILLLANYYNNTYYCSKILAGVLLLFHNEKAYYWLAASTYEGNKKAAPSLLVWEALKLAKKRGATSFDFEGIYDDRFPQSTKTWQGFTKFKQGFGGREITYIGSFKN